MIDKIKALELANEVLESLREIQKTEIQTLEKLVSYIRGATCCNCKYFEPSRFEEDKGSCRCEHNKILHNHGVYNNFGCVLFEQK